jgi:hypothetical protein
MLDLVAPVLADQALDELEGEVHGGAGSAGSDDPAVRDDGLREQLGL